MLTCNRAQYISRAIESILCQRFQEWELIVVHDGLNGPTEAIMNEWTARDNRIRYFHRLQLGNIANACNYGIARARGEYIAILDDDDYWARPDKLEKQVAFLAKQPEYAGCGGGLTIVDPDGNALMSYLKHEEDSSIRGKALSANPMNHSTSMFRRAYWEAAGGYDESLAGFQDWDLWLKLGHLGRLYNFPEVFAYYTMWDGCGSYQQHRRNTRSAIRIVLRHREAYAGFTLAFPLVLLQHAYAYLPSPVRRYSFSFLSLLKKRLFAERKARLKAA